MSALNRLKKDHEEIKKDLLPLCKAGPKGDDLFKWEATIKGPKNTPYEGGIFKLEINFPDDYPFKPPRVRFITEIFHPNIGSNGMPCLDILRDKWNVVYGITQILVAVNTLLDVPNPVDPVNNEAGTLLKKNPEEFNEKAREMTQKFAVPD